VVAAPELCPLGCKKCKNKQCKLVHDNCGRCGGSHTFAEMEKKNKQGVGTGSRNFTCPNKTKYQAKYAKTIVEVDGVAMSRNLAASRQIVEVDGVEMSRGQANNTQIVERDGEKMSRGLAASRQIVERDGEKMSRAQASRRVSTVRTPCIPSPSCAVGLVCFCVVLLIFTHIL
jgi:hypothetical protein